MLRGHLPRVSRTVLPENSTSCSRSGSGCAHRLTCFWRGHAEHGVGDTLRGFGIIALGLAASSPPRAIAAPATVTRGSSGSTTVNRPTSPGLDVAAAARSARCPRRLHPHGPCPTMTLGTVSATSSAACSPTSARPLNPSSDHVSSTRPCPLCRPGWYPQGPPRAHHHRRSAPVPHGYQPDRRHPRRR